jgi:hypothetical protein
MAGALFHITQMQAIPLQVKNAIRSVAFLLDNVDVDSKAAAIASVVGNKVDDRLKAAQQELEDAKLEYAQMMALRDECKWTVLIMQERIDESSGALDNIQEMVTTAVNDAISALTTTMTEDISKTIGTNMASTSSSYKDTLLRGSSAVTLNAASNPAAVRLQAQAAIRAWQILINIKEGGAISQNKIGNRELVQKANDTLGFLSPPGDIAGGFVAVSHLRNGWGILLEAKSAEVIIWIKSDDRRKVLANNLEEGATIQDKTYMVVVPFVPLTLQPEVEVDLREIEEQNQMEVHDIIHARWIKLDHKCLPTQTVAHLILSLSMLEAVNKVIKEGLSICHKRVYPKKLKREPIRCLKCQGFGHIASACSIQMDICGTCLGSHKTTDCSAFCMQCCASCQTDDHASWSRKCPTFVRKCDELDQRSPENVMPYFPTSEPWTQVMEPPKLSLPPPPPPRVELQEIARHAGSSRLRQTMFNFKGSQANAQPLPWKPASTCHFQQSIGMRTGTREESHVRRGAENEQQDRPFRNPRIEGGLIWSDIIDEGAARPSSWSWICQTTIQYQTESFAYGNRTLISLCWPNWIFSTI